MKSALKGLQHIIEMLYRTEGLSSVCVALALCKEIHSETLAFQQHLKMFEKRRKYVKEGSLL